MFVDSSASGSAMEQAIPHPSVVIRLSPFICLWTGVSQLWYTEPDIGQVVARKGVGS